MPLLIKRVYEAPAKGDGKRILVDRLWPRGLSKQRAKVDVWMKDLAPSTELRNWFGHDPAKWTEFQKRYRHELAKQKERVAELKREARAGTVTLVYGAHDQEHNNAAALVKILKMK